QIPLHKETNLCTDDPGHNWQAMHDNWNNGALDGFVRTNDDGEFVMGQYDETDLPFYYALANQFTTADRYFASVLSQT
ncbi:alkaline phosphatase family protein, partial [Acinetobacter baumannii]